MKSVVLMATILVSLIFSSQAFAGGTPETPKTLRVTVKNCNGEAWQGVTVNLTVYKTTSGKVIKINKTYTTNTSGVVEFSNVNFGKGSNDQAYFVIKYKFFSDARWFDVPEISNNVINFTYTIPYIS